MKKQDKAVGHRLPRPILSLRYRYDVALFRSREEQAPRFSKGGAANVRIDLLIASVAATAGLLALLLSYLSGLCKRASKRGR